MAWCDCANSFISTTNAKERRDLFPGTARIAHLRRSGGTFSRHRSNRPLTKERRDLFPAPLKSSNYCVQSDHAMKSNPSFRIPTSSHAHSVGPNGAGRGFSDSRNSVNSVPLPAPSGVPSRTPTPPWCRRHCWYCRSPMDSTSHFPL